MSFVGHSGAVRQLHLMENENSFLSGSQDRTVRLWSARSFGNGAGKMQAQSVYQGHRKPIQDLTLLETIRLVASTDGIVQVLHALLHLSREASVVWRRQSCALDLPLQIWDPFLGTAVREFEWTVGGGGGSSSGDQAAVSQLKCFQSPSSLLLAAASSDTCLRFLDVRMATWAHQLRLAASAGPVRALSVDPHARWAAVGQTAGQLSLVDLRFGRLLSSRRIADLDVSLVRHNIVPCMEKRITAGPINFRMHWSDFSLQGTV